jgi:hypothetical protein
LAPFLTQRETIDRVQNGVEQRSYFVMFNDNAPVFGHNKQKVQSWLQTDFVGIEAEDLQHVYEIGIGFRGIAIWATPSLRDQFLAHNFTQYVEEDQVMRAFAPFTQRPDWGQIRSAQRARNLDTTPSGQYNAAPYPSGGADTTTWDWTSSVYNGYSPRSGVNSFVWIVDTGVLSNHQEFYRNSTSTTSRVTRRMDYVTSGGNATDCNGHGSHCAGSAAGLYRGLAPAAEIGAVRVLNCQGSGTNANVVAGFDYVANNQVAGKSNILSASLGGGASATTDNSINNGVTAGVIAVVAAGNDNANACNYSPARAASAITVMASGQTNDARASFTNTGSCGDVFAPGVGIHSAWYTSATTYNTISGTSMATPLTAGAIAIYASTNYPVRGTTIVKNAIRASGTPNVVTGSLLAGTPNVLINANWP